MIIIFDLISRIIVSIAIVAKKDFLDYSQAKRAYSFCALSLNTHHLLGLKADAMGSRSCQSFLIKTGES
jgi:hypothetical protein